MVHQITFVVTGIRATIAEIEKLSFFYLPKDYAEPSIKPKSSIMEPSERTGRRKSSIKSNRKSLTENSSRKSVQFDIVSQVRSCREYFTKLEMMRNERVVTMKKLFESIGPTLVKLESLILGTHTGVSWKMKQYYTFWEKEMFTLLIR